MSSASSSTQAFLMRKIRVRSMIGGLDNGVMTQCQKMRFFSKGTSFKRLFLLYAFVKSGSALELRTSLPRQAGRFSPLVELRTSLPRQAGRFNPLVDIRATPCRPPSKIGQRRHVFRRIQR